MVGYVYAPGGTLPTSTDTAIKISLSCGTVVGQLGFGFLADHVGRKRVTLSPLPALTRRCTELS